MSESGGVLEVGLTDVMLDSYDVACYTDLPSGPYVKLTVSDTGHGMTQEIVERIFEPFYTTKEKGEGTGLGLSIVHGIVKNLRGVITVYSEPWVGTTFEILIPRIECKTGKRVDEIVEMPEGSGTVLFVEDEESVHYMMKEMIERLGYKIVSTLNSTEGLKIFRDNYKDFDLVITDQSMPGMTGIELGKEIISISPITPVLLLTSFNDFFTQDSLLGAGIKKFLVKPVSFNELSETIRILIQKAKEK
jgi:CheY-like chemotaxis protein